MPSQGPPPHQTAPRRFFEEARRTVLAEIAAAGHPPRGEEEVALDAALGRILARAVLADRDQPPFDRSTRDGFAVRAGDVTGAAPEAPRILRVRGEVAAGAVFAGTVATGEAVEIMTGAPLPAGADAVVMVEHTGRPAPGEVAIARAVSAGENVVPRGSELRAGAVAVPAGRRLEPAVVGLLASLGCLRPWVWRRPRVAIVSTGDEIVPAEATPRPEQIRDSNRHLLAAQVARAGGDPVILPLCRDDRTELRATLGAALGQADLLLVTGGVSAGKYDFVEESLAALGARQVFDRVDIRPGRPVVFGMVGKTPFFGLPGNPLSALVTFELLARPVVESLAGAAPRAPLMLDACLGEAYTQRRVPLTVFVPAALDGMGSPSVTVRALVSQGSGDLAAMARADALLVLPPDTQGVEVGARVTVLPL